MLTPKQILKDRYQLQEKLGERPNRQTWLAIDLEAEEDRKQQVVIKLLAFGGQMQWQDLKLFEREAQTLREVKHPCIPKYYNYFSIDQQSSEFGIRNSELGYKPLPSGRKEFGRGTSLLPNNFNSELRTKNSELERSD